MVLTASVIEHGNVLSPRHHMSLQQTWKDEVAHQQMNQFVKNVGLFINLVVILYLTLQT